MIRELTRVPADTKLSIQLLCPDNEIDNDDYEAGKAADSPSSEILSENLLLNRKWKPVWCHTYNQSEHLEVVDFMVERFVWFGPVLCIRNKVFYERHKDLLGEG